MISKEKLIKKLENTASLEDEGVLLISTYLISLIEKSSFHEDEKRKLLEIAEIIREESTRHRSAVGDMIEYVHGVSDVLYTLLRAHETYPGARVSVIAIASSPRFRVPLEARVASSFVAREVYFRPYTHEELVEILWNRAKLGFQPGIIARDALEVIAELAGEHDLRFGIELMRESGEAAEEEDSAAIREEHVETAARRLSAAKDEALPRGCIAIYNALEVERGQRMGKVYPMVREEVGSYSTFSRRVDELERRGMIRAEKISNQGRTKLLYRLP